MTIRTQSTAIEDGCCEEGRRAALSRRHLLQLTGAGIGAGGLLTATTESQARVAFAAEAAPGSTPGATPGVGGAGTGQVLVVISLRGGFDGLSAVVPVGDPAYALARPGIALPTSTVLPLNSMFGLAPGLAPLRQPVPPRAPPAPPAWPSTQSQAASPPVCRTMASD